MYTHAERGEREPYLKKNCNNSDAVFLIYGVGDSTVFCVEMDHMEL